MTERTGGDASSEAVTDWCRRQLMIALEKLVKHVNRLAYTRNPVALAATAEQCNNLEAVLVAYEFQLEQPADRVINSTASADALVLIEAHQMLAQARGLVRAPLEPIVRNDNVVELKPNYRDLTDAAFERMLASSDIPRFLSPPADWQDYDECDSSAKPSVSNHPSKRPTLTLVHNRDSLDAIENDL